jgi:UDP-3-O-[3-hydroxymyristoyl] glucosamine N-acyltransferase
MRVLPPICILHRHSSRVCTRPPSSVPRLTCPDSCQIGPGAVLGDGVSLGERVGIGANAVIGEGVAIGADTRIAPGAVIYAAA